MSEDRKHHPYSPSTLQAREVCPSYSPRQSVHERAIAGTLAHAVVQTRVDDNRLSDEDALMAARCADFFDQRLALMEKHRSEFVHEPDVVGVRQVLRLTEVYLPVDDLVFPDALATTAGYVDEVLISFDQKYAEIMDWKFGAWAVEAAADNLQGIAYVLGLFRMFPSLEKITFFFKQPYLDSISDATFTRDQIPTLYLRVCTVVERSREANRTNSFQFAKATNPGCLFCDNIGRCPVVAALALKVGQKYFPVEVPDNIDPTSLHTAQGAAMGMKLSKVVESWAGSFRRQIANQVIAGTIPDIEGYGVETRSGNRSIIDDKKFNTVALKYITRRELNSTLSPGITAVEAIIKDKAPRGEKEQTVEKFQKEVFEAGAIERGSKYSFLKAK